MIIVVAPTIAIGRRIAKDFKIKTDNVRSTEESLRGFYRPIVLFYDAPDLWRSEKLKEIMICLKICDAEIIHVPEYILRPSHA